MGKNYQQMRMDRASTRAFETQRVACKRSLTVEAPAPVTGPSSVRLDSTVDDLGSSRGSRPGVLPWA
jgi:hypothetical protein